MVMLTISSSPKREFGSVKKSAHVKRLLCAFLRSAFACALLFSPALGQGDIDSRLETFITRQRTANGPLEAAHISEGNRLLDEISTRLTSSPELDDKRHLDLLRVVGRGQIRQWRGLSTGRSKATEQRLSDRIVSSIKLRMSPKLKEMLQRNVLLIPHLYEPDLRAGAAILLGELDDEASTLALLNATKDESRDVRDCAAEAVIGRDSTAVHSGLLRLFIAVESGELELTTIPLERHFQTVGPEEGSAAERRLYEYARERFTGASWQTASRAISLSKKLNDRLIVPLLIEAMSTWISRKEAGGQAGRVLGELEQELSERSGLRLGQRPTRWRTWWRSIKNGRSKLPSEYPQINRTRASFFGLRPNTDRVIFVLDGSGSMEALFTNDSAGTSSRENTRFKEATAQLIGCLEKLGEGTRFDVIIFNDKVRRFRSELVLANESTLKALKAWIKRKPPEGGTNLRGGVVDAMRRAKNADHAADTIIVLCDGETLQGPSWVAPFIRSFNEKARVRFSAVQLGGQSDGTLEELCTHTDGNYTEISDSL